MSELQEMFGEPSGLLVQESAWLINDMDECWPTWDALAEKLMEWKDLTREEADGRIGEAVRRGEVLPKLDEGNQWTLTLDEATFDRITRRVLAIRLTHNQQWEDAS